jgi:exopolysaccharide biosynthesis polyprenyl glycosylphosphotransferase
MLGRKQEFNLKLNQIIDSVLLALAFWAAYALRAYAADFFGWFRTVKIPPLQEFYWQMLLIVPFTPLVLEKFGYYSHPVQKSTGRALTQLCQGMLLMVLLTSVIVAFGKQAAGSRAVVLLFPVLAIPALLIRQLIAQQWLRKQISLGRYRQRVLLAGPPEDVDRLLQSFTRDQLAELDIVDRIDISTEPISTLVIAMHEKSVERVIFAAAHVHLNRIEQAVNACEIEGVEAWLWADFIQTSIARPTFDAMGGKPMLVFRCTPEISWALFIKSVIDKIGAVIAIILASPLMLFAWIGIRLASPGPAIFVQMRSGRHGHPFRMYKFRTMCTDAEQKKQELQALNQMSGPVFKIDRDPRIFPLGRFLRKWSIDELPQLFNVLKGDMSLVGPRPLPVYEVEKFADPAHRRRLSVKPGLTCLWQISGRNEIRDFDQWVQLDLKYIDNWSLWLDIVILLRTIPAVMFGSGAR